jgi:hypothetical protein
MVRPELPTAAVGSSQAPTATVDNSAPSATRPQSTYKSGKLFRQKGPLLGTVRGGLPFHIGWVTGPGEWLQPEDACADVPKHQSN